MRSLHHYGAAIPKSPWQYDSRGEPNGRTSLCKASTLLDRGHRHAALATLVLTWLGANSTTAGMVFLVLVVWWATQAGIVLSIFTAVLCAICFDYFFLPPVRTLRIEGDSAMGGDGLVRNQLRRGQPALGTRAKTSPESGATPGRCRKALRPQSGDDAF
ncbi:MAG: DUF4118 domain-containing protein [Terracidiphilus sp.]